MADAQDLYYRSVDDLNRLVREAAARLPPDIDLVVGIPRSGLLVANLLALHMHLPVATLTGFLRGEVLDIGSRFARRLAARRKVLVVDDSVSSGRQLRAARATLQNAGVSLFYATAYCTPEALSLVDFAFEILPQPRAFEWNILNGEILRSTCVAFDAIVDARTLGDADRETVEPRPRPFHYPVGHVASTHAEAMRETIEAALKQRGMTWGRLWLAPAINNSTEAGIAHLASAYRESGAKLFIARDPAIARAVADTAQQPAFSMRTMQMIYPGREPGSVMTFPGQHPPDLNVPLTWFVRQAVADVAHRLFARRPRIRRV